MYPHDEHDDPHLDLKELHIEQLERTVEQLERTIDVITQNDPCPMLIHPTLMSANAFKRLNSSFACTIDVGVFTDPGDVKLKLVITDLDETVADLKSRVYKIIQNCPTPSKFKLAIAESSILWDAGHICDDTKTCGFYNFKDASLEVLMQPVTSKEIGTTVFFGFMQKGNTAILSFNTNEFTSTSSGDAACQIQIAAYAEVYVLFDIPKSEQYNLSSRTLWIDVNDLPFTSTVPDEDNPEEDVNLFLKEIRAAMKEHIEKGDVIGYLIVF